MLNSLYALILTDSLHLPTTIGYFNTRPAACQARQSAHAWLKGESQSVESLKCFSNAAMNILDQCCTAIEKNPAHYVDLRVKPVDDLSDPETTPFRVYYETAAGDRHFTVMETVTDLTATHSTSSPNFPAWNSTVPALMMASPSSSWNKPTAPMIVTTVSPSTLPQPSAPTKSPRILPPRAMSSPGPSSALLPKTKKMPAIGPPLTASLPTANMIWNAAIITDVQLFALACYNVWLYNPIINQTAKQNYFSVFTKLFKSKSA